jgi:hypothetical protein
MTPHPLPPNGEIVLYQTKDGHTRIECRFQDETLWLSQVLIADLFQKDVRTINEHLQNIYEESEQDPAATIRKFRIVRQEGKREVAREIEHYSLDAILSVGYRMHSPRGTQFRRWATERLREYLVKGFTMDDERLKDPPVEGSGVPDYFDELLKRIRDIRASERRMYLRVKEIFALAADYGATQKSTGYAWRGPGGGRTEFIPFLRSVRARKAIVGKKRNEFRSTLRAAWQAQSPGRSELPGGRCLGNSALKSPRLFHCRRWSRSTSVTMIVPHFSAWTIGWPSWP